MGELLIELRKANMQAMKDHDTVKKGVLSLVISSIALAEKEDGKTLTVLDTIKDSKDNCSIDNIMLKEEMSKLTDFERQIIYGRYFEDKTQAEISNELGVNQVYVSRSEKKILKRMKNNMSYSNVA